MAPVTIAPGTPGASFNQVFPVPPGGWKQQFTSYAGNAGTFDPGYNLSFGTAELGQFNGVIYNDSTVTIADIRDGTSNTFSFGEHSHGLLKKFDLSYGVSDNSWNSGRWYDTLFASYYPPNVAISSTNAGPKPLYYLPTDSSSLHPGGVNMAFCDGSVRFVKNTISSWVYSSTVGYAGTLLPIGVTWSNFVYTITPNARLGVYQALSTRAFGEVISADSY
jgi:prepilin-type processing-associated H-X9-DG protein